MSSFRKKARVWVEDKDEGWLEAEVADNPPPPGPTGKVSVPVLTAKGKRMTVTADKLLPRDKDEEIAGGHVDDMTKLTYLNEPGVLYNLRRRYMLNEIYTYTGRILIAVNPFTNLPHLYIEHMMQQYKGIKQGDLSPHVFAITDAAYSAMMHDCQNQSILVSGESGAGKTETTKLIMQYLTYIGGRTNSNDDRSVEQQVLESNPLLEAFGNAKTVRNDNSSRFGKFVEIQFDDNGKISGAAIRTYLLERSRVVQINDPERNFHCFYQLCASGKDAEEYKLGHPSSFQYLNKSKTFELEGRSNVDEYRKTRKAMDIVGITRDDQDAIFRTLAAILHLGNIDFSPGKEPDSSAVEDEKSNSHLEMAAKLLMCDQELLITTLCTRPIHTPEGTIIMSLDCAAAVANRDALAKSIYSRLFDWLVENINKSISQDVNSKFQIGILDIYGFESFKANSFEQFCINFANEKLQQHFNEHVFKMEQEDYKNEEINWSYIEFIDNQDVLDLIEKKPFGIISLLDEQCLFPKSTHKTFSTKLFQSILPHPRLEKTRLSETDFTISHYAGKVTYQTESFLEKNRDYVVAEHINLLSSSKCPFVSGLFTVLPEESVRAAFKFSSVASRFKQQLQSLMETLNSTEPHYIRCVKPNSLNRSRLFENQSVMQQLRCGGVLEAVRISLAGYPTRRSYAEFVDRFGVIATAAELQGVSYDEREITKRILEKLNLQNFELGRTKVFLRAGQIAVLDARLSEVLYKAAKFVQDHFKTYATRQEFIKKRKASVLLQSCCRGFLARKIYTSKRENAAAIIVQKYFRRWLLRRAYMEVRSAALLIQSCMRAYHDRSMTIGIRERKAAQLIRSTWRRWKLITSLRRYRRAAITIQCYWRRKLARRELRRRKLAASEAGALREAKSKLERQMEDLSLKLTLEKRLRAASEESKAAEVLKHKKENDSLNAALAVAKEELAIEHKKTSLLQSQLEDSLKQVAVMQNIQITEAEIKEENLRLKETIASLTKSNEDLKEKLSKADKSNEELLKRLQDAEEKVSQLQQTVNSLQANILTLENESRVIRQEAFNSSTNKQQLLQAKTAEIYAPPLVNYEQSTSHETPAPLKQPISRPSFSRKTKINVEHEEYQEIISKCITENLGFKDEKPVAACIIYKCLLNWHAFAAERTSIFDHVLQSIIASTKADNEGDNLPYWLSNTSALLYLLQRNLRSNGLVTTTARHTATQARSPLRNAGQEDARAQVEARYPAILFKQKLTANVETIFGQLRDKFKNELSPLLSDCIQAPKSTRGKMAKSPPEAAQLFPSTYWDNIVEFLDSFMGRLRQNYVPYFFIRKFVTQLFSYINMQLFNSLLLRRECCTFSNGEYLNSGLQLLKKWIDGVKEELSGSAWDELKHIRQAVDFLTIHQKRKKTLKEIEHDVCPALSVRQIYRICSVYWDDRYGTQTVSNEVVAALREMVDTNHQELSSNSFLLDDDPSIPFSIEDLPKALPEIDPMDVALPESLAQFGAVQFFNT